MKKKEELTLREKGYIPIEEYVAKNIEADKSVIAFDSERQGNILEAIRQYAEASAHFHQPGGDGHHIVQRCLQKYLDCKFIQKNRRFRFDRPESVVSEKTERVYQYISTKNKTKPLVGTQADIYYLLFEAEQDSAAARRCKEYVHSGKLHLTAVLTSLIEQAVTFMEESETEKFRQYGRIIRAAYMTPAYVQMETAKLYSMLGYSKKQYYTLRNQGITLLSEYLFGFFAGEKGMAELYINGEEIVIAGLKEQEKK